MEKFGRRGFAEILIGAVLLLLIAYFAYTSFTTQKEYAAYRDRIFSRAYEESIALLCEYREGEDASLSSLLSGRLSELPLTDDAEETARRFCADIAAGEFTPEAKERALSYAEELLSYLSRSRSRWYEEGWREETMTLPSYPSEELPTAWVPKVEEPTEDDSARQAAALLLGSSYLIRYTREDLLCYRCASGYAEYREGTLVRALLDRTVGDREATEEELRKAGASFLKAQGYPSASLRSLTREGDHVVLLYETEKQLLTLSLTKDDGRMRAFRAEDASDENEPSQE